MSAIKSYQIAERFISPQGEGVYTGTMMAFIRFAGCSVGKKICQHCDTDFENMLPWQGGGLFNDGALASWVSASHVLHVCLTGGEPLDQPELQTLVERFTNLGLIVHIETSGTIKYLDFLSQDRVWMTMSPKPGWLKENYTPTHEFKVIVNGLGNGPGWPTLADAIEIERTTLKPVFLQPRNLKTEVHRDNLMLVEDIVRQHPQLRLSIQTHKLLRVR